MIIASAFFAGICVATFSASAVFFLKFWLASRDSFYLMFAIACSLFAIDRFIVVIMSYILHQLSPENESGSWIYLIRLTAFILISAAVWQKNKATQKM
jgi:hypothetical protein